MRTSCQQCGCDFEDLLRDYKPRPLKAIGHYVKYECRVCGWEWIEDMKEAATSVRPT